jgi:effector-binding domain-containing protein
MTHEQGQGRLMTMTYEIVPADLQEQQVACTRAVIPREGIATFLATAFAKVPQTIAQQGLESIGPPYARYHFREDGSIEVEAGFPVSGHLARTTEVEAGALPAGHVVTTVHAGAYDQVGTAYEALTRYLRTNGYEPAGGAWESYLDDPEVPQPRTKVYLPAQKVTRRHH